MPVLMKTRGFDAGMTYRIRGAIFTLGRNPDCDVNDVFQEDPTISRRHARIVKVAGKYYLEDLKSRRGTSLNGQGVTERASLADGDRIEICGVEFTYYRDAPTQEKDPRLLPPVVDESLTIVDEPDYTVRTTRPVVTTVSAPDGDLDSVKRTFEGVVGIVSNLGSLGDQSELFDGLLTALFHSFPAAESGFVVSVSPTDKSIQPSFTKQRSGAEKDRIRVNSAALNQAIDSQEVVLSVSNSSFRSLLCAPLLDSQRRLAGVLQLESSGTHGQFGQEDVDLVAHLAPHVARSVRFMQMQQESLRKHLVDRDLELARRVQLCLLPQKRPEMEQYRFFDYYSSAYEVAGDYYDYITLPRRRLAIVMADASGRGIGAALLMSRVSAELRYLLALHPNAQSAINLLNRRFCSQRISGRYVRILVAVIDSIRHKIQVVNAGHVAPLIRHRDGSTVEISAEERGIALGIFPQLEYPVTESQFDPGDTLCIFSDGIPECRDEKEELYGVERLRTQFAQPMRQLDEFGQAAIADLRGFIGHGSQSDDICLLLSHRGR